MYGAVGKTESTVRSRTMMHTRVHTPRNDGIPYTGVGEYAGGRVSIELLQIPPTKLMSTVAKTRPERDKSDMEISAKAE